MRIQDGCSVNAPENPGAADKGIPGVPRAGLQADWKQGGGDT